MRARIIEPEASYISLDKEYIEELGGLNYHRGKLPDGGLLGSVEPVTHPGGFQIYLFCGDDGCDYLINEEGVEMIDTPVKKRPPKAPVKPKQKEYTYQIGDIVTPSEVNNFHHGKLLKVVGHNVAGYDYVCSNADENYGRYGFYKSQLELADRNVNTDEDVFKKEELLDILKQDKPAEQILLDLMDHITN